LTTTETAVLQTVYPVMEHFYTLQGEGHWAGTPAYFVRLGGCDVGCTWCDVKESWPKTGHEELSAQAITDIITQTPARRVVITGGEPTLHNLTALTDALHSAGLLVHIETSGTQPLTGSFDWVTFSPKKFKAPLPEYYAHAHELKIIVHNKHDLLWAEGHAEQVGPLCVHFLQPDWFRPESAAWIIEHAKAHPHWRMSLQTHKYLDIP